MSSISQQSNLVASLKLTPEERLLVLSARLSLAEDQRDELNSLLVGPLDWDQVVCKSQWHKLSALLYRHLRDQDNREWVPVAVMSQLKAIYLANVARNLCFQSEFRRTSEALKAHDIPVIALKGAALAGSLYGDIGLRPMVDLDLLVRHEDADTSESIVRELGYRSMGNDRIQSEMRTSDRQLAAMASLSKPVVIEIHTHIVEVDSPLRFDIDGFWQRAVETDVFGLQSLTLGPADLITHLSINFFKDRRFYSYSALGQLCDLAEATRFYAQEIDWNRLTSVIAQLNLQSSVFYGLYLAQHLLGAPVPDQVLRRLEPVDFRRRDVERLVRKRVLGDTWVAKALVTPSSPYSWWAVALSMLRRVFPAKRYFAEHYGVPGQSDRIFSLYLRRWVQAMTIGARFAINPWEARDDLAVDRWLHSLYQGKKTASTELIDGA